MKSSTTEILPLVGTSMGGGFYAGRIRIGEDAFALIVAPKAEGEHDDTPWNKSLKAGEGSRAYFDGRANTLAKENWCYGRSGINLSAVVPTYPYTPDFPAQTLAEAFQAGGEQAFEAADWYWSSTQHVSYSAFAWSQHFLNGNQDYDLKDGQFRARAVRRLPI